MRFACFEDDERWLPAKASSDSVGWDIRTRETIAAEPGEIVRAATGLKLVEPYWAEDPSVGSWYTPDVYLLESTPYTPVAMLMTLRSSLGAQGWVMPNAPAVIDPFYVGRELQVLMVNASRHFLKIERGERIAQILFTQLAGAPHFRAMTRSSDPVHAWDEIPEQGRAGWGSSGTDQVRA